MRISRAALVLAISLLLAVVGCTKQVTGTAEPDPDQPPLPLARTATASSPASTMRRRRSRSSPNRSASTARTCKATSATSSPTTSPSARCGHLPPADIPRRRHRRLFGAGGQCAVPGRRAGRTMRHGPQFQRFVEELWGIRIAGGPGPPGTNCATSRRRRACPTPSPKASPAAGQAVDVTAMDDANFESLLRRSTARDRHSDGLRPRQGREARHLRQRLARQTHPVLTRQTRAGRSSTATPNSAAPATSQPTTAIEPAGMIASAALRSCTRTRSGLFLSYST